MAASKSTASIVAAAVVLNNVVTQQIESPALSTASSIISSDSSATNHPTSPDTATTTPTTATNTPPMQTNNTESSSPVTPIVGDNDDSRSSEVSQDIKCTGSVLEKLSLFERLEQQQQQQALNSGHLLSVAKTEPIYGRRSEESYKSVSERDPGENSLWETTVFC